MKLITELLLLAVFFVAYYFQGMYVAIGTVMALYTLQMGIRLIRRQPISRLEMLSYASIVLLGGMSLVFHNELFFKWKPSVIYSLFAIAIIGTRLWTKSSAMQKLLNSTLHLPNKTWNQLDYIWCSFLIALAVLNLMIAYTFSTDIWVYFKLFGTLCLLLIFLLLQAWWLAPHLKSEVSK